MKMCVHRVLISGYAEAVVKYMDLEWFSSRIISAESNVNNDSEVHIIIEE